MSSPIKLNVSTQAAGAGAKVNMSRRLSRLEKLPAEIRHHLLSVLDVPQLKSLVHASPIFHSQYLHSRRFFLQKQVELTLGTAIVDAYFAYLYSVQTDDITDHDIHVVLPLYFTLTPKRCLPSTTKLTEDEALGMLMRHRQIVEPLVQYSAIQMLQCLNKQSFKQRPRGNGKNVSCSDMEVVRLTRAIYRYQLYHQAIGFAYMEVSEEDEEEAFLRKDIFMDYFCCLELWEAEELVSFDRFVWVMYHSMVDIIYSDNALSNQARSLGRAMTPEEPMLFGAQLLCELLPQKIIQPVPVGGQPRDGESERLIDRLYDLVTNSQLILHDDLHQFGGQGIPLSFHGDTDPKAPSLAWTMIWGDVDNLPEWRVPDSIRKWGYVFWDAATLEETGGIEVLESESERMREDDTSDSLSLE